MRVCSIDGCGRPYYGRGWCSKHYQRWFIHGDPNTLIVVRNSGSPEERFWAKVEKGPDCWIWNGARSRLGYGSFNDGTRTHMAYRYSWEIVVGPIPEGLVLDHLCRNPPCVNPAHLRAVTRQENTLAEGSLALAKKCTEKTHCKRGHEFTPENTYMEKGRKRRCRQCGRLATAQYLARKVLASK